MSTIFVVPYIQRWDYSDPQGVAVEAARRVYNTLMSASFKTNGDIYDGVNHVSLTTTGYEDSWLYEDDSLTYVFSALYISELDVQAQVEDFLASLRKYIFSVANDMDNAYDDFYPFLHSLNVPKESIRMSFVEGNSFILEFSIPEEINTVRDAIDRETLASQLQK